MVLEQIGYLCEDSALPLIMNHQGDIARFICESGRADLIDKYAVPIARGECGAGIAYSEDADAFSFRTLLRRDRKGYILSGHKTYVTGGQLSDVFLVYALDEAGDMLACLVQHDDPGVSVTPAFPMGMRTAGAASVTFEDVPLSVDRILEATDGLTHAQRFLSSQRLWITCAPLGRSQAVLEDCAAHLASTLRFDTPVAELNNVEASLGRMYIAVESARAMLYHALGRVGAGYAEPIFDPVLSAAKCFAVEQVRSVVERAFGLQGATGSMEPPTWAGICVISRPRHRSGNPGHSGGESRGGCRGPACPTVQDFTRRMMMHLVQSLYQQETRAPHLIPSRAHGR
ncbi:acyl-CoA dehydrogenase family protein [Streptomyces nogalater]